MARVPRRRQTRPFRRDSLTISLRECKGRLAKSALTFHTLLVNNLLLRRNSFDLSINIFGSSRLTSPDSPCCVGRCVGRPDLCLGEVVGRGSTGKPTWRKAKRCDSGACVEIATQAEHVMVRRSTDPDGTVIILSRDKWKEFVARVKHDDLADPAR
jgi:Domain of unknown function (DUF397)